MRKTRYEPRLAPVQRVQERLGHATIAMTLDIYSHVAPGLQEAAALAFDEVLSVDKVEAAR